MTMHINTKQSATLLIGLGMVFLTACSSKENKEEIVANTDAPVAVTVANASGNAGNTIDISGQVEASQTANISTRVMGYITSLKVKVGDHVNKGQVIATISNNDIVAKRAQTDAMIAEAEAALKNAQKDYDRFTALYKQQSASAKELDNVTLQYNAMKAKVDAAKQMRNEVNAMLAYTTLTAPFSGIVIQKFADAGSMANPGMPIVSIEQSGTFQVSAEVPETEINEVKLGETVTVDIKSATKTFQGKIVQVNPSSQFSGGQYIIKVSIPDNAKNGLYAGMYANISITPATKVAVTTDGAQVLVPVASIVNKDQLTGLYTVSAGNTALLRWVRLGKTYGDKVEVLSGLAANESFIVRAEGKLYNGVPVKVVK
ncbi:MAG: efflux RND transporter periplasmic adaptor subunit [Bacteroidota bacterium]|nr:efflux RND transporter periplasmic adaptor subunit [Bacteroidota bacterium]